ncbi:hypothetical protein [Synechococcus sp. MIT S1220]|uniref:hypothetical protein n=1 Tax=Synechococcus sp. MIT S1220 TaxID=3082549 RepID=UPI0039AFA233
MRSTIRLLRGWSFTLADSNPTLSAAGATWWSTTLGKWGSWKDQQLKGVLVPVTNLTVHADSDHRVEQ